jgi:hypothetical protein
LIAAWCLAEVAQLVEQWTENPCVGGSSPPLGTIYTNLESVSFVNSRLADFCFDNSSDNNWLQIRWFLTKFQIEVVIIAGKGLVIGSRPFPTT